MSNTRGEKQTRGSAGAEGESMKMRKKTMIIIVVTTITMVSIVYAISQTILLNSFARLEEQNTRQNMTRVLSALDGEFSELNSKCGDWAEWDDTYNYVNDLNSNYNQSNLVDASFINMRINFILFVNSTGQLVSGMATRSEQYERNVDSAKRSAGDLG